MSPQRETTGRAEGTAAPAGGPAALPCLNSNICNGSDLPQHLQDSCRRLTTNHRKTAYKLAKSVSRLCGVYGVERVGFLTLTFADHVTSAKEAGRRYHSLSSGVLGSRYRESICVLERMKSGRIHFHLLVVLADDIRTGFNFEEAGEGVYTSANVRLRSEWAFWRRTAKEYGFGRTELMPVKSNEEGLSKYVGKYIAKHVGQRETRDKGVRLVRYSRGASIGSNAFMFASPRSRLWRQQVKQWAERHGCADLDAVRAKFGHRWAYFHRDEIMREQPPEIVVEVQEHPEEGVREITLRDIWEVDRLRFAQSVAIAICEDVGLVESLLYHPSMRRRCELDFFVRPFVPPPRVEPAQDFSDVGDVVTIWADGTCERSPVNR